MRNLNGHELNGRTLRVDNAANERTKEEIRNLQTSLGGTFESPYGPEIDPEKAPEAISKAVASLPPEQMFELAKQMKQCIQTNPNEARNMLLQNPQLSYALLQALVVMKIVDPNVASSILHRTTPVPNLMVPEPGSTPGIPSTGAWGQPAPQIPDPYSRGNLPPPPQAANVPPVVAPPAPGLPYDPRGIDPRARDPSVSLDPRARPPGPVPVSNQPFDPRMAQQPPQPPIGVARPGPGAPPPLVTVPSRMSAPPPANIANLPNQEQEKAALIMQVLNLSEQQIAMLPAEQRQSIQLLKDQIARGTAH